MNKISSLFVVLLLLCWPAHTLTLDSRTIEIIGIGEMNVIANLATLDFNIVVNDRVLSQARSKIQVVNQNVQNVLSEYNEKSFDITYGNLKEDQSISCDSSINSYLVFITQKTSVNFKDISRLDSIFNSLRTIPGVYIQNVFWAHSDYDSLWHIALDKACQNATKEADYYEKKFKTRLKVIKIIPPGSDGFDPDVLENFSAPANIPKLNHYVINKQNISIKLKVKVLYESL